MNISETFIRRPVATILLIAGLVALGVAGFLKLPVAALPQADFPTINVTAQLAGASPDTMANSVAMPLVKQFETIAGIDTISASSVLGSSQITIQFELSRDIDAAAADVQAALARAERQLPANMTTPPSYSKSNPADAPILILVLTSQATQLTKIDAFAENIVAPAMSTISGVAEAQVYGAKTYAVRVEVDPRKLNSRGLSLDSLTTALQAANSQTPTGTLQDAAQTMTVDADTQRVDADQFRTLVIAQPNGRMVYLGDVANVADSVAVLNQGSWLDGEPAIAVAILRQPGANTVAVVDAIMAKLPSLRANLPSSMQITAVNDASTAIRAAVSDVQTTLLITICLVVLVIFLFLKRIAATLIPGLAVPLSLLATLGMMYVLGYSIDNISLLGLTLSVGLVVDDAIVMLENIVRKVEEGMAPFQAAIEGSREVTGTIISMSISLVAVFLPILLMGGVIGRVFNEFGIVVTLAILCSAVISLTVTPMLAARLPRARRERADRPGPFDRITAGYGRAVGWCLDHRGIVMLLFVATFAASGWLFVSLPRSFFPTEDIGLLSIPTQGRQDISYAAMSALQAQAAAIVSANPAVAHVTSSLGSGPGGRTQNLGSLQVQLKPKSERPDIQATILELRRSLADVPGLKSFVAAVQSLRFGSVSTQSTYQLVIKSGNEAMVRRWATSLGDAMRNDTAMFIDVASNVQDNALQAHVAVDNERASALGITSDALRTTLEAGFGSLVATEIQTTGDSYNVIVEYDQSQPWDEGTLADIRVANASGVLVPLTSFATISRRAGPVVVNQTGQLISATLSFNLPAGVALSNATDRIEAIKRRIDFPSSVLTNYSGAAQIFQQESASTGMLILAAILTIYVVLGVFYESFAHPMTILSGLPSAALGALLALKLFGFDLSIIALIGMLMLIGIVKKNAIMMIDVALMLKRDEGQPPMEAIANAAVRRFRPIMMTTFCALLGALPIALGTGASSELRQPLGIAVVGGLLVSQALTLFITPVIFVEIERISTFLRRLASRDRGPVTEAPSTNG